MLRITRTKTIDANTSLSLRVEGDVRGLWVDELRRVCDEAIARAAASSSPRLVLDLEGVLFIDGDGIALFRDLAARDIHITNCSPFVAEQLKEIANGRC